MSRGSGARGLKSSREASFRCDRVVPMWSHTLCCLLSAARAKMAIQTFQWTPWLRFSDTEHELDFCLEHFQRLFRLSCFLLVLAEISYAQMGYSPWRPGFLFAVIGLGLRTWLHTQRPNDELPGTGLLGLGCLSLLAHPLVGGVAVHALEGNLSKAMPDSASELVALGFSLCVVEKVCYFRKGDILLRARARCHRVIENEFTK